MLKYGVVNEESGAYNGWGPGANLRDPGGVQGQSPWQGVQLWGFSYMERT